MASLDQGLDPIGNARKPDRGLCQLRRTRHTLMSCVKIVEGVLLEGAGNEDSGLHHDELVVDYEIGSDRLVAAERCREILYARGQAIADETCYVLACCVGLLCLQHSACWAGDR